MSSARADVAVRTTVFALSVGPHHRTEVGEGRPKVAAFPALGFLSVTRSRQQSRGQGNEANLCFKELTQ